LGQAPKTPLTLKPDAPERYIVVPGDTLWGIAERYTDSPWRWSELWEFNKDQIKDPHRIYPGNVIVLDRARAQLALGETVKLTPRVRAESLAKQEIPSIPPNIIEPFLVRPLVVEPDGLDKAPTIVGTENDRVMLSSGDSAYVRGISGASEETWFVYRQGKPLVDPDTNATLGFEAIYLGTASVQRPGDPAMVRLDGVLQEIGKGDKLVRAGAAQPVNYAPRAPSAATKGRVMTIYNSPGRVGEAGRHSVITINRGKANGLEVGHVLALHSAPKEVRDSSRPGGAAIKIPEERYGLAFVFRVFDRVSYALVMNVTRPVNPLDVVQNP
jgi:hypothetical protein